MYEYVVCIYKYIVITRYLFYDLYRQIALCNYVTIRQMPCHRSSRRSLYIAFPILRLAGNAKQ